MADKKQTPLVVGGPKDPNAKGNFASFFEGGSINGWLSFMAVLGVFGVMAALTFVEIRPENKDLFNMGFGAMIGWATGGMHFFQGSSQGSKNKTEAMTAEMARDDVPEPVQPQPEITQAPPPKQGFGSF